MLYIIIAYLLNNHNAWYQIVAAKILVRVIAWVASAISAIPHMCSKYYNSTVTLA